MRRGGDDSGGRLQPGRHADARRQATPGPAPAVVLLSSIGLRRSRRLRLWRADPRPARRRARRRRLPGRALRPARLRPERRPLGVGDARRLRRRRPHASCGGWASARTSSASASPSSATARAPGSRCWPRPRERRRIAAVVTIGAPGSTGADLVLEQQQAALDRLNLTPAEREQRIALQKQIQAAVVTGKGWEGVPKAMRREADTAWLQSLLTFDPAKTVAERPTAAADRPRRARSAGAAGPRRRGSPRWPDARMARRRWSW